MKKLFYLLGTLLLTAALAACSSSDLYDNPPEQPDSHQDEVPIVDSTYVFPEENENLLEPDSIDPNYGIKYYSLPPYAYLKQGTWYVNKENDTILSQCYPDTDAPYNLIIVPWGEEGIKALEYLANQENSIIQNEIKPSPGHYCSVIASKYFESPYLYVSDSYYYSSKYNSERSFYSPLMTLHLNPDYNISDIENRYKDIITLREVKEWEKGDPRWTFYDFDCHVQNSYEMLRLCEEIAQCKEVEWAEPGLLTAPEGYTTISTVPVSDEVKAFFDEALPQNVEEPSAFANDSLFENEHYSCYIINDATEFESMYLGNAKLPDIDFDNYTLVIGQALRKNTIEYHNIGIRVYRYWTTLVINVTLGSDRSDLGYIPFRFWGIFPKFQYDISSADYDYYVQE